MALIIKARYEAADRIMRILEVRACKKLAGASGLTLAPSCCRSTKLSWEYQRQIICFKPSQRESAHVLRTVGLVYLSIALSLWRYFTLPRRSRASRSPD